MSGAYYNEIDPFAAEWTRELIRRNIIAAGEVDERSIEDVQPEDLRGFTQCHFFAGIGVWSYALRLAGWPDDRPVWTGSCPCQPFSGAGKEEGFSDPRHLWPAWFRLARVYRPDVVFGEQVERAIRLGWFDLVSSDMEREGYAIGSAVFGAHSVGAPHIRQRLYFVAHSERGTTERFRYDNMGGAAGIVGIEARQQRIRADVRTGGIDVPMADTASVRRGSRRLGSASHETTGEGERVLGTSDCRVVGNAASGGRGVSGDAPLTRESGHVDGTDVTRQLVDAERARLERHGGDVDDRNESGWIGSDASRSARETSPSGDMADADVPEQRRREFGLFEEGRDGDGPPRVRELSNGRRTWGFWHDAEWIECRDGKARPVEPGTFPLAHGAPARVGRLRGYGNAIVAEQGRTFIESYLEVVA